MIHSVDPATGTELARFAPHSEADVEAALDAAVRAQARWRTLDVVDRTKLLRQLARVLRAGKDEYARLINAEMGKPAAEAEAEIEKCAVTCEHYAEQAPAYLAERPVPPDSVVVHDPLGVVLAVMPWNYPFWQFFRFAAPALAAGNGIVLKHAGNVPRCALAIADVMAAAGTPDGLVGVLLVEADAVAGLIADDRIAAVTFTGSTQVGTLIAAQAGAALKKQVLELGGSDPFVVLADADVPAAAATAVEARFVNAGQSCVNAKRFIVEEAVADEFVRRFTAAAAALRPGADLGPLARENLREALHDQVRRSVAAGASLVLGGKPADGPGFFYPPTVLDHVTPGMAAFDEETFGPVAAITRVAGAAEAIAMANRTEFGLGAALWTRNEARARRLARELEAGAVFVNGMVASDARLPFGGIKKSGYGRELGAEGIREFTNVKTVWRGPGATGFPPAVLRPAALPSHDRGGGASTVQLVTRAVGARTFLNGTTHFDGGAGIPLHTHNCPESVVILEGSAIVEIDGVEHRLERFDTTYVDAGTPHRFRNASATEPMRILWTYASVDATRTLVETGVTTRVDAEHR
ncbi:aldehyde dehydrogenase family protein [Amycolatopsis sp. NPDC098790]|uniref:aldehyde dehydrogenase family protein n=1 Tax=Amycolatopsis sp. NPDC098790 TaxID=3363939 RepID=UPI0038123D63